jgi:hypothetical protein
MIIDYVTVRFPASIFAYDFRSIWYVGRER